VGDRYAGGVGAASNLGTKRWRVRATVDAQHETAERWHGVVHTDEGNIGRTDVLAGAEVTWRVNDDWHVAASVQLPVYTHVEGGQLDQSAFVGISVGSSWHLFGDDDEHHHAKVAPGNWTGLDLAEVSADGSVVPLVPVPGKITVFDFWATWCEPCRVVDHELAEVVRRHPDDLAVRKYDVEDADSPASRHYLGDATLPHLVVFGRDGKLLWERSAAPRTLAADVEKLVTSAGPMPIDPDARRIEIEVRDDGFSPKHVEIGRGESVTLVFTRKSTTTCATDVHFVLPDQTRIDEELPLGVAVSIPLRVAQPGAITYSCGMDMEHGVVDVR
jgi:thiol-disulfide isomerase/thioredoxin